jgi:hypothetical protein
MLFAFQIVSNFASLLISVAFGGSLEEIKQLVLQ